jgi:hypothetical protein
MNCIDNKISIPKQEVFRRKHLQFRDDRMDSRGAGRPNSEIFRVRIIRGIRETFVVNGNEVCIGLGASGANPSVVPP